MVRKPKQQRAINTVNLIVESGFLCVAKHGMSGTTTQKISDISGVAMGSIYEYFENKEDIFNAMRTHFVNEVVVILKPSSSDFAQLTIHELIRKIFKNISEILEKKEGIYLKWIKEGMIVDSNFQSQIHPITMMLTEIVFNYVMAHPELMRLKNMQVMIYIFANSGIFTLIKYLTEPITPSFTFDQLVDGLGDMVQKYVSYELAQNAAT